MKTCPLINTLWKDVFAHIAFRDIFIPTNEYLFYLSSIIRNNDSLIYRHHLPHSTHTMTCRVDLIDAMEDAAQEPYTTLSNLPNFHRLSQIRHLCYGPCRIAQMCCSNPCEGILSRSTYINCIRRFSGHDVYTETKGDVRSINYRFGKAVRRPSGLRSFFAEVYEDMKYMLEDDTTRERSYWDNLVSVSMKRLSQRNN
ncbi:uncharacterized protein EV420DRAFT_1586791 [Desarmillaria tabescens]|uniref:Uncharacterized protein n=1 Tax=Armillaria tabescens TaxID=1929756 RepID=A0AA39J8G8_ARMTA|nr:uncharacterized protein EV420DRAFT_1586791 [Desarmillaria tabescens]KAK0437978.1 hypothetical protein EV420DRAFT_1586791 [Desarmillaria tabescens]